MENSSRHSSTVTDNNPRTLRVGSWNIGTLTGNSIELVKILKKRKINIACIQETKWLGTNTKDVDGLKLWFSRKSRSRNGEGILVDRDLRDQVVEIRRVDDRVMTINLVLGGITLNVINAYAPQAGLDKEDKRRFWEDLDKVVRGIPLTEKLLIGGDFNGHIGSFSNRYDDIHGSFDFGDRGEGGVSLLDFVNAFELVTASSSFQKREQHLVTFRSVMAKTQIDYLLLQKGDRGLCKDFKVIPSENISTQHKLVDMDLEIRKKKKKKRVQYDQPRIRWGGMTGGKAQEIRMKLVGMGAWGSSGDTNSMWARTAGCIREAAREVLGVSKGCTSRHQGDW
ncbi:uncharacterized protein LOC132064646 [Lycium ferocissimum]|uniref:uncharacterized protein LOC132064646 n=1 Tax=Lycium ferocissimum TaxID=112874 RepID=UPI0028156B81|nr:uncharacterized protein LOC132064646 [Lycium ferocissimum]